MRIFSKGYFHANILFAEWVGYWHLCHGIVQGPFNVYGSVAGVCFQLETHHSATAVDDPSSGQPHLELPRIVSQLHHEPHQYLSPPFLGLAASLAPFHFFRDLTSPLLYSDHIAPFNLSEPFQV